MRYEVWGDMMPAVTLSLEAGESIYTQSGGMSWMTDQIEMTTNMKGGLMKGFGRMFSGESLFMATYTAKAPEQQITLASSVPGQIKTFEISPSYTIVAQKGAFLCATPGVELKAFVTNAKGGLFGGEGLFLTTLTGPGKVWLQTMSISELAQRLIPYMPTSGN